MKHKILLLIIISIAVIARAQDCNIGNYLNLDFENGGDPISGNVLLGVKFSLSHEGTLKSVNLLGRNTGAFVQMAVYCDSSGVPNDLFVSTAIAIVRAGIVSIPVTPVSIPEGDYWVMAIYNSSGGHAYNTDQADENVYYFIPMTFGDDIPANASDFLSQSGTDLAYFLEIECAPSYIEDYNPVNKVTVYPNPASDFLFIDGLTDTVTLRIFNSHGQLIDEYKVSKNDTIIDISALPAGLYHITGFGNQFKGITVVKI
jgi:hypothetical protein